MFGDSFFTGENVGSLDSYQSCFRPHVWGFFFHKKMEKIVSEMKKYGFSSPCLGILFSQWTVSRRSFIRVGGFRPHVWGFFFHLKFDGVSPFIYQGRFSSPCLGILFSLFEFDGGKLKFDGMFSSPCLGILFSQQARDAPRSGLSIALLRRGFPIDWNSHYFHPLTYCFLRFHAYRRGFLLL